MVFKDLNFSCILVLGATASGKTDLAHKLSEELSLKNISCEIVNLDAFQIYKELDIGTAKPSADEIKKYHYHGVNVCELHENLDANTFARMAWAFCEKIYAKSCLPICVGGSGLYLRAFLHGLDELPVRDENIRAQIKDYAHNHGWPGCHDWLKKVDPVRATELHPNDKTRIERALEIFLITGKAQSAGRTKEQLLKEQNTLFPCYVIHSKRQPEELKKRIHERVECLFAQGWSQEVEQLFLRFEAQLNQFHSMQAIGYKQILESMSMDSHTSKEQLIQKISTLTWQYAKKQLTWYGKEKVDCEFTYEHPAQIHELVLKILKFIN